jgi:hypothetical protein
MRERLTKAINDLPEREHLIMTLCYYEETTMILRVKQSRVSQIHASAVLHLRARLATSVTRHQDSLSVFDRVGKCRLRFQLRHPSDVLYKGTLLRLGREEAARSRIGARAPGAHDRNHLSALIGVFDQASDHLPETRHDQPEKTVQAPAPQIQFLNWAHGFPCRPSLTARTCVEGFHCLTKLRINLVCDGRYSNQQQVKINSGPIGAQGTEY